MSVLVTQRLLSFFVSLERVRAALAGPDPDGGLDRDRPDLAVTDLAGAGRLDDDVDQAFGVIILGQYLDADLGDQVDRVLGTTVDLGVSPLPTVAAGLGDRQTVYPEGLQGLLDLVEPVRLHDGGDELHASTFLAVPSAGVGLEVK